MSRDEVDHVARLEQGRDAVVGEAHRNRHETVAESGEQRAADDVALPEHLSRADRRGEQPTAQVRGIDDGIAGQGVVGPRCPQEVGLGQRAAGREVGAGHHDVGGAGLGRPHRGGEADDDSGREHRGEELPVAAYPAPPAGWTAGHGIGTGALAHPGTLGSRRGGRSAASTAARRAAAAHGSGQAAEPLLPEELEPEELEPEEPEDAGEPAVEAGVDEVDVLEPLSPAELDDEPPTLDDEPDRLSVR